MHTCVLVHMCNIVVAMALAAKSMCECALMMQVATKVKNEKKYGANCEKKGFCELKTKAFFYAGIKFAHYIKRNTKGHILPFNGKRVWAGEAALPILHQNLLRFMIVLMKGGENKPFGTLD